MGKKEKLLSRFQTIPKDFTWDELCGLLGYFGYKQLEGSGSRVKFFNAKTQAVIRIHKPHPAKILKRYMIKEILNVLSETGDL